MSCNNMYCYWNYNDQCCTDSEEAFEKAIPNTLDCPSSLRKNFEEQLYILIDECTELLNKMNMRELITIKKFIENQRK
ncbi:hypothetical protein BC351_01020 [Paenibacillus ferrarius]|uniref:Uncharacterized protein n=1 Tax=Paenibacillus ferrarius TaxID=1469647 RepID=A0A1V4HSD6_9BACL|nr:hypothetical protein BC351_01020 [Paenibacillus ferrarius]